MRRPLVASLVTLVIASVAAPPIHAQPAANPSRQGAPRDPMQEGLPLRPARTLTFSTNVGHWMSVDVSPDGRTLVFDLLGDLYTMPITGGTATPLTREIGRASCRERVWR